MIIEHKGLYNVKKNTAIFNLTKQGRTITNKC